MKHAKLFPVITFSACLFFTGSSNSVHTTYGGNKSFAYTIKWKAGCYKDIMKDGDGKV